MLRKMLIFGVVLLMMVWVGVVLVPIVAVLPGMVIPDMVFGRRFQGNMR
ncbi:MAG TPA: hypothetical protein VNA16_10380 [Abditibacteriaceae bacterium]|nr:hypothetical protein [Abditibacteriaceae bacterium]